MPVMSSYQPPASATRCRAAGRRASVRTGLLVTGLVVLLGRPHRGWCRCRQGQSRTTRTQSIRWPALPSVAPRPLVFDKADKFIVYIETKGKLSELSGDCNADSGPYDHQGDKLPKVSMKMLNSAGDEIELPGATGAFLRRRWLRRKPEPFAGDRERRHLPARRGVR
jgi:hypothetical protein